MRTAFVVVVEILGQNHVQVFFIKNNDMIQTVSADRANHPYRNEDESERVLVLKISHRRDAY